MTIQEAAKQALQVQDACNSRGIARAMVSAMDAVAESGAHANTHAITFMFLYKLAALNGHEPLNLWAEYTAAEAECNRIAAEECVPAQA